MDLASLSFILPWFFTFWLLGWLLLPAMRRLLPALPDGGLCAGRVLFLALLGLFFYWGAGLQILPLSRSPWLFWSIPPLVALASLRKRTARREFREWVAQRRVALLCADAVFAVSFTFFLWGRMRHPELHDLEKLMDSALLGTLVRGDWLPAQNPWFSGSRLTSYYHFGPLLGSLPVRALGTPLPYAYNLVQPLFCALFITTLWSLGAALSGSLPRGVIVVCMVALLGHFEPVRQWKNPLPNAENNFVGIDWWSTSRVLPDTDGRQKALGDYNRAWKELPNAPWTNNTEYPWFTISEYPAFTMFSGDAHAHFYALPLAALLFCLCFSLFGAGPRRRRLLLVLLGLLLADLVMTNTWDVPLYALLAFCCAVLAAWKADYSTSATLSESWLVVALAPIAALPYLRTFKSQVSGVQVELWPAPPIPFLLLWGFWLILWFLVLLARSPREVPPSAKWGWLLFLPVLLTAVVWAPALAQTLGAIALTIYVFTTLKQDENLSEGDIFSQDKSWRFSLLMGFIGLGAVLVPQLLYMKGPFGDGALRHQDTVFKFGLQGWLLLGTAASVEIVRLLGEWRGVKKAAGFTALGAFCAVPLLCAFSVLWTRAVRDASRSIEGRFELSLDGARWMPPSDRAAMNWLDQVAAPGDIVLEAVGKNEKGGIGGDFTTAARISALTGMTAPLGWPQHVWMWGEDYGAVHRRWEIVRLIYEWSPDGSARTALRELKVKWVFVGEEERRYFSPAGLKRLSDALTPVYTNGDTMVLKVSD